MKRLATLIISLIAATVLPLSASALQAETHQTEATRSAAQLREQAETQRQTAATNAAAAKEQATERLEGAKRKTCDTNQARINSTMTAMGDRRQHAYDHITKVYDAVKAFYATKKLSISDYDTRIASIYAAQTAAKSAMDTQQSVATFTCAGDNPRSAVADFKTKRRDSIDAMQTYRQSVKDLIQAVKTANTTAKASAAS